MHAIAWRVPLACPRASSVSSLGASACCGRAAGIEQSRSSSIQPEAMAAQIRRSCLLMMGWPGGADKRSFGHCARARSHARTRWRR